MPKDIKNKPFRIKKSRKHIKIGEVPGTITVGQDALLSVISVFSYTQSDYKEQQSNDIGFVLDFIRQNPQCIHWVQIKGLGNVDLLKKIGSGLKVNALVLEDIADSTQRPKYDEYDGYVMAISRLLIYDEQQNQLINSQFSTIAKEKLLISFQETYDEHFEALKNRLRTSKGIIREEGTGYLFYAIMDTMYDRYFALLDQLEESLEGLEANINKKPRRQDMFDAQRIKRTLITLHRATGPERDKMNEILRSDNPFFSAKDKIYFRDAYDHCMDIIETVNSLKELSTNLTEIYLSTVNNQMNNIMRILTIVSSIFIPLTFIVGVYGMNFAYQDPITGKLLKYNMPELYQPHGYLYTLIAMALIAIVQLIFFWKKGWFDKMR